MPYDNNNYGYGRPNYGPRNNTPRTTNFAPTQQTKGVRLENPFAGRFMDLNFFGKTCSIQIGAVAPGTPMDWQNIRNAQTMQVNLTFSDLSEIWDLAEEIVDSIKNTGTFTSTAVRVTTKQDALLEISNGSNLNQSPGIYLVIYKNLDASNRTNQMEVYPFRSTKVLKSYDHTSGAAKEENMKLGEFKKFVKCVREACKAFTMAQAHAIAHTNFNDKISAFKAMAAMTAAMGIDMQRELDSIIKQNSRSGGQRQGGGGGGGNRYGNQGNRYQGPRSSTFENNASSGYQQPSMTTTVDDPVDISLPMDQLTNVDMSEFS